MSSPTASADITSFELPHFRDPQLLNQAVTHRSYAYEHPEEGEHNERLEFLGDAVLNFISGEFLFKQYPHKPEGELTALRSALVDESQLANFARKIKLGQHLKLGKGAENQNMRDNPNLLSCTFEAVVGAYFLDQESEVDEVWDWVVPFFEAVVETRVKDPMANPKSQLQEWAQRQFQTIPTYRITGESGPDHDKQFTAEVWVCNRKLGKGQGKRKQDAEKSAAHQALSQLLPAVRKSAIANPPEK